MADFIGTAASVSTSGLGTANGVIYGAAVALSSLGIGLADTGSLDAQDHEDASGAGHAGSGGAGANGAAGAGATVASSGDTPLGFLHANLDPHAAPVVALVGQVLHG